MKKTGRLRVQEKIWEKGKEIGEKDRRGMFPVKINRLLIILLILDSKICGLVLGKCKLRDLKSKMSLV